jgi:3D-(3,5/4)-trihydroxycyclohexane-1,2-dione acylhydrolase (decyclizing)
LQVDFAADARSMGCTAETVETIAELDDALVRARASERTYVIAPRTSPDDWTEGGAFWDVGVPEVSDRAEVLVAREDMQRNKERQRLV